jgi:hypothetical protein
MIDDRYPTEVLDEDDDDGTMPANVAELEKVVIGRRIVSAEKRPDLDTSYTASTLRWRPMPEPLLRASTSNPATARVGHFLVQQDTDPDPDGGPIAWVVIDTRDDCAMSDWFTYADAITDAMQRDREDKIMDTVTPDNAASLGEFGQFRKTALSTISAFTVPAGTRFKTPEGLYAEDEECRIAFDTQGGVYPIRESVFQQSYERVEQPYEP